MKNKSNPLIILFKEKLRLFLSISLSIFLFILFFQPFPLEKFDFNNSVLFVAGFGAIIFIFSIVVRAVYLMITFSEHQEDDVLVLPSFLSDFILIALSSVAFAFYLRYVGLVSMSFYIIFKIVLICLVPSITMRIFDKLEALNQQNISLITDKRKLQQEVAQSEEDILNQTIEFVTENSTDNLILKVADIVFLKSADNYVEIVYREAINYKKKLVRNTLKNIEVQIKPYTNFIRCHRTCIVNIKHVDKLNKGLGNPSLVIKNYPDLLPVSRQYLLKLKEVL